MRDDAATPAAPPGWTPVQGLGFDDLGPALPSPDPFPNPWIGAPTSMANLGIVIPPSVRPIGAGGPFQFGTTSGSGSHRPPSVPPGLEACFTWGYALGGMQNENRQLRDQVGWLEAQAIEDTSSQPTSMGFLFFLHPQTGGHPQIGGLLDSRGMHTICTCLLDRSQ